MNTSQTTLHRARHAAPERRTFTDLDGATVPLPVLPGPTSTMPDGAEPTPRRVPWTRRGIVVAAASVATLATSGGAFVLGAHSAPGSSVAVAPLAAPATAVAPSPVHATPAVAAPVTTTVVKHVKAAASSSSKPARRTAATSHHPARTSTVDTSAGCGHRAVTAGVFNAACSEYQGYLDPGVSAGRAPSSGDIQRQACLDGELPGVKRSQC